jgi:hypothetical protein
MLLISTAAACGSNNGTASTGNSPDVPTEEAEDVDAPTQTSAGRAGTTSVYPADLRTGITGLDTVLEAVTSGDAPAIAATFRLLETPCTTADGLGGPPKCGPGEADQTIVTVFPVLGSEGTFVMADDLPALAESLEIAGLFGVYQVTGEPSAEESYWPSGTYGVVLAGAGDTPAYTLLVAQGNIVRIIFHYDGGPEEAFDRNRGPIIVPPLQ